VATKTVLINHEKTKQEINENLKNFPSSISYYLLKHKHDVLHQLSGRKKKE
jgi:hypothetical protein